MDLFAFEGAVLRLKEVAGVRTDREVAALLGFDASAFNKRKIRGSFPSDRLKELAASRPDLGIDMQYVLTGVASRTRAATLAGSAVPAGIHAELDRERRATSATKSNADAAKRDTTPTDLESQLLADLRRCSPEDRGALLHLAARLAEARG